MANRPTSALRHYPGTSLTFVPTFAGGMFEGLMANLVVPETTWGPHSFGLNDLRCQLGSLALAPALVVGMSEAEAGELASCAFETTRVSCEQQCCKVAVSSLSGSRWAGHGGVVCVLGLEDAGEFPGPPTERSEPLALRI